jgi:hypothetical protein
VSMKLSGKMFQTPLSLLLLSSWSLSKMLFCSTAWLPLLSLVTSKTSQELMFQSQLSKWPIKTWLNPLPPPLRWLWALKLLRLFSS